MGQQENRMLFPLYDFQFFQQSLECPAGRVSFTVHTSVSGAETRNSSLIVRLLYCKPTHKSAMLGLDCLSAKLSVFHSTHATSNSVTSADVLSVLDQCCQLIIALLLSPPFAYILSLSQPVWLSGPSYHLSSLLSDSFCFRLIYFSLR